MSYLGAGFYGYQRCPVCGYGMLNGICYNTAGHQRTSNYANNMENSALSGSVNHYAPQILPNKTPGLPKEERKFSSIWRTVVGVLIFFITLAIMYFSY